MQKLDELGNPIVEPTNEPLADEPPPTPAEKKLSQSEVNEIVKERLAKQNKSFLGKLGIESDEEIDGFLTKIKESDLAKAKVEELSGEITLLREKVSFNENNIDPERYDDVRIYFKGKGVELTAENLKAEIAAHKEWVNKTTVQIGGELPPPAETNEREEAFKLFGV